MPDDTFSGLFDDTAHLDWSTTDGLRRRARQRRRRQQFAAGVAAAAVVAVVATGAAFAIDRGPGPEPVPPATPAPSVSPSESGSAGPSPSSGLGSASGSPKGSSSSGAAPVLVTDIPLTAMLTAGDAGGSGWQRQDGEDGGGDWRIGFVFSQCEADDGTPGTDDVDRQVVTLDGPQDRYVFQDTQAFPTAATARAFMSWMRTNVGRCASFRAAEQPYTMSIVDTGFAGDESFIVKTVGYEGSINFYGFVREGNLVTEILPSDDTQSRTSSLGSRAAARMCTATRTC